ncbi:MAG: DNA polymerase III subunit gamma and tau [Ornithinimicrobium sp.]|uniref:DNA polymerase III subunit gamma and tau n=1 Tax=Ornithinimicrobium sp. TaxID=1977084 RepID=UPI0026E0DC5A|nr:DNA polymerase III subunit gamma and tau [Ornithinimicrobium sp.]MDO5739682.1 DNA polymerase III subunit gamma and tau [Ornithinimicrobium sp.]
MSKALYRRYRPETFTDVIGQEHVTEPLMQALRSGRVNHAYLFSGPRGCGKTTSARILARCLNCEQGPTPEPCGTCDSCVGLARDGAGTVDVIEIDAASHGGVDDARDLRERAAFGPAQSRYKVYIIDEAHMVTPNGFNALLKVVEEPPPHVKFIFATTEPEKVLATIRSRTHHYPFHLVPPQRLTSYLEQVSGEEGVALEPGVLSFVTRAGGGSVRDSLSVLDQLISGAGKEGLTYERTASLLGFTDVELLDAVVDAVAAGDAATVFQQVDKVMESGHDPRRFVEDLLERYRDLIVLSAIGDRPAAGLLPGLPDDQIDRMRRQASVQGPESLSRLADLVNHGLTEMAGAVSFRLMLELLVARLLLPGPSGEAGYGVRLDRIERRLSAADERQPPPPQASRSAPAPVPTPTVSAASVPAASTSASSPETPAPGVLDTAALRRQWPDVLEAVHGISRQTWSGLQTVQLLDFDGRRVVLGKGDRWWVDKFLGTRHEETVKQAFSERLGLDVDIHAVVTGQELDEPAQHEDEPQPQPPSEPQSQSHSEPQSQSAPPRGSQPTPSAEPAPRDQESASQPAPAGPGTQPVEDHSQRGRVRTRATQGQAPPPTPPPAIRGRTRPEVSSTVADEGEEPDAGSPDPRTSANTAGPSMAEQLGATRRPTGDGPGWAEQTQTSSAPDWLKQDDAAPARSSPRHRGRDDGDSATKAPVRQAKGDAPSEDDDDLASSAAVGQPVIESVLGGIVIAINDEPVG